MTAWVKEEMEDLFPCLELASSVRGQRHIQNPVYIQDGESFDIWQGSEYGSGCSDLKRACWKECGIIVCDGMY